MSEKNTKMAAHGGETEDASALEDLQMILSLADDVDNEFIEDVMLKEAGPFEVKEVTCVLERLSSSCEECESSVWSLLCGPARALTLKGASVKICLFAHKSL